MALSVLANALTLLLAIVSGDTPIWRVAAALLIALCMAVSAVAPLAMNQKE